MPDNEVMETIYGKYHKFTIIKKIGPLGGISFWIRRDGKPYKGSYSSLSAAVEAARDEG